jgi:uncharacterized protein (DUF2235 family)
MTTKDPVQEPAASVPHRQQKGRSLVLCFDGTSNKYRGDGTETNVLKIFRLLDKHDHDQCERKKYMLRIVKRTHNAKPQN